MLSVVLVFVLSFTFNLHGCDLSICYHLVHDSIVSVPFCVQFSVPSGVPVDVPAWCASWAASRNERIRNEHVRNEPGVWSNPEKPEVRAPDGKPNRHSALRRPNDTYRGLSSRPSLLNSRL